MTDNVSGNGSPSQSKKRRKREGKNGNKNCKTSPGMSILEKMLDPKKAEEREEARYEARKTHIEKFGNFDMQNKQASSKLFEILWYTQLPCFDIRDITSKVNDNIALLKRCYWKGEQVRCSLIFKMQPTDRGMCCSFNMEAAEKIYKESQYTRSLRELQTQDKKLSFQFKHEEQKELNNIKPAAGINEGLTVLLDAHRDLISP